MGLPDHGLASNLVPSRQVEDGPKSHCVKPPAHITGLVIIPETIFDIAAFSHLMMRSQQGLE